MHVCERRLHTSPPSTMRVCSGVLRNARSSHRMCACVDATKSDQTTIGLLVRKEWRHRVRRCRYSSIGQRFLEQGYSFLTSLSLCCPVRIGAYSSFADTDTAAAFRSPLYGRTAEASTVTVAVAAEHRYHCGRKSTARIIPLDSRRV